MFFNEFEKYEDAKLNKNLLWEYKVDNDLDLFTRKDFDAENLKRYLIDNYGFKVKNKYKYNI